MSMSAEEVLVNCQKQFDFIKTDINILISYVKQLLSDCEQIDNTEFFKEKIIEIKNKLEQELKELNENAFENEVSKDTHVAIETYNKMQRYLERKREVIADFKAEVFNFRQEVIRKEQEIISNKLDQATYQQFEQIKDFLINNQTDINNKAFANKFFLENETRLRNLTKEQIFNLFIEELNSTKQQIKDMVNFSISSVGYDQELVESIKEDARAFMTTPLKQNLLEDSKQFFKNAAKTAEQEAIRKDNVIKIVNAIRNIGYVVNENDIRKIKEKNIIIVHGEKITGETADFAIRLDGSMVYNWEGFEGKEHDLDAQAFLKKLKEYNVYASDEFKKQYREPKYIAKQKAISQAIKNKKQNSK